MISVFFFFIMRCTSDGAPRTSLCIVSVRHTKFDKRTGAHTVAHSSACDLAVVRFHAIATRCASAKVLASHSPHVRTRHQAASHGTHSHHACASAPAVAAAATVHVALSSLLSLVARSSLTRRRPSRRRRPRLRRRRRRRPRPPTPPSWRRGRSRRRWRRT